MGRNQGIRIKGFEMVLVWHEKASRTALQTSSLLHTHTRFVQTHNMTTVKQIAEHVVNYNKAGITSSLLLTLIKLYSLQENLAYMCWLKYINNIYYILY